MQRHVDFGVHQAHFALKQVDQLHAQIERGVIFQLFDFRQLGGFGGLRVAVV